MNIKILRARVRKDFRLLERLDRKMFSESDAYQEEDFRECECFILFLDGKAVGNAAFKEHTAVNQKGEYVVSKGCLYVASTGVIPSLQGRGWGTFLKAFEIAYAKQHGFHRMETTVRESHTVIINLNKKFSFRPRGKISNCYKNPAEDGIRMELMLKK